MKYEDAGGDMDQIIMLVSQRLGMKKEKKVALLKSIFAILLLSRFYNMFGRCVIDWYCY